MYLYLSNYVSLFSSGQYWRVLDIHSVPLFTHLIKLQSNSGWYQLWKNITMVWDRVHLCICVRKLMCTLPLPPSSMRVETVLPLSHYRMRYSSWFRHDSKISGSFMKSWDLVMTKQMPTNYTVHLFPKCNIEATNLKNNLYMKPDKLCCAFSPSPMNTSLYPFLGGSRYGHKLLNFCKDKVFQLQTHKIFMEAIR